MLPWHLWVSHVFWVKTTYIAKPKITSPPQNYFRSLNLPFVNSMFAIILPSNTTFEPYHITKTCFRPSSDSTKICVPVKKRRGVKKKSFYCCCSKKCPSRQTLSLQKNSKLWFFFSSLLNKFDPNDMRKNLRISQFRLGFFACTVKIICYEVLYATKPTIWKFV